MYAFESLEDAASAFVQATQAESEAQFAQSDVCADACTEANHLKWGENDAGILKHLGTIADKSRSTMYARLLVGRVFPPDLRNEALSWSIHEVCARTDHPLDWLQYAANNDLGVRRLKAEIGAVDGGEVPETRPVYLLDSTPCIVDDFDAQKVALVFDGDRGLFLENPWPKRGQRVIVTLVMEPAEVEVI